MSDQIQLAFIEKELKRYLQEVKERMSLTMNLLHVNNTGEGEKSISHKSGKSGQGASGQLSFKEYLRMVDMGVGRGHPLGGLKSVRIELMTRKAGNKFVKDNTFKTRRFYSRVAYGKLTPFYNRLLYGFGEAIITEIKKDLNLIEP